MSKNQAVNRWINSNFFIDELTVESFPYLPAGKLITDKENNKMIVYFHEGSNSVRQASKEETENLLKTTKWGNE